MNHRVNLAILTTSQKAISESFIQAHKSLECDSLSYFYGGHIPAYLEGYTPSVFSKILEAYHKVIGFYKKDVFHAQKALLAYHIKRLKINVILAEYGVTGADCLEIVKRLDIPLVVHFHGYDLSRREVLERYEQAYKRLFNYASFLVVVSRHMESRISSIGAPLSKIVYNPYGPDPSYFNVTPSFSNQNILTIGRFVDKKAPYYVILAFQQISEQYPQAKLKMVGDGHLLNTCINLAKHLNLEENVEFLGSKSTLEIQELMNDCSMFVQHSVTAEDGDQEGMPNTLLEACAAGLPVISTRHAGIMDLIVEEETGYLVDEHDVQGMSRKMLDLLSTPSLSEEVGCRAKKRIQEYFTRQRHLNTLSTYITKAINDR